MTDGIGSLLPAVVGLLVASMQGGVPGKKTDNVIKGNFPELPSDEDDYDVFVSYCKNDQKYWNRIKIHLEPMRRDGVRIYSYDTVEPGAVVPDEAKAALQSSVVAVLLVSPDYLASDVMEQELPDLLDRADQRGRGHTRVLRLQVGKCHLHNMDRLTKYQPVGVEYPPLNRIQQPKQDDVYVALVEAIIGRLIECNRYPTRSSPHDAPEVT